MKRDRVSGSCIYTGIWIGVLIMTALLSIWIRPAADDFFYETFGDGGWMGFVETNLDHYRTMSGRVFVHLVLYPLLCLNMWPFRVFLVVLIGTLSAMIGQLAVEERRRRWEAMALAVSVFFLMGIEILFDGALWGAGAMNYLFPVSLVIAYAIMVQRCLDGGGSAWLCIPAFFCASTVEMTGILPCVVFVYLCLTNWEKVRERWGTFLLLGLGTLAGYLFLYTSPGVSERLNSNSSGLPLLDSILVNYSMLDRKVIGQEGCWAVTALTLASCGMVLLNHKSVWGYWLMLPAAAVILTGLGVIYNGVAVAFIAAAAFAALLGFAVWSYFHGERQVPMWMLCIVVSLGVCLVSPVMGSRLVMPSAILMTVICVRNFMKLRLPQRTKLVLTTALAAVACMVLLDYNIHFFRNAQIVDDNTRIVENYTEGVLVLNVVPDERYSGAAVPTVSGFGEYYLKHHGLEGTSCAVQDPTAAAVVGEDGVLEEQAVLRDGIYYLPVRAAAKVFDAEVRWELASAVVQTHSKMYCFHIGNYAANLGHGICDSIKLSGPVRSINGRIYVPLQDFNALFGTELTVSG